MTEYTFGLHIKFPVKLEGVYYLYCITLNSPRQAALSTRLYFSAPSAKHAEKIKQDKEAKKEKEKGKILDTSAPLGDPDSDSDNPSFSEVVTDTSTGNDIASDLLDEETFFEKAYDSASFIKSKPKYLDKEKDDDYQSEEEEEEEESGHSSAFSILDALRSSNAKK